MKRCSRCILPETYPDIRFDSEGVCSKCREYDAKYRYVNRSGLEKELESIIKWAKGRNRKFDCIVPFSGGKDSAYTLYMCRRVYGMKVLAVNFNNGLRTPEALKNIENIIKKTDVSYLCYGPGWGTLKKLYREFFLKTGQFCFACDMGIWATVQRTAALHDVPLIVSGFSAQIESRGEKIYSYNRNLFTSVAGRIASATEMEEFLPETKWRKFRRRLRDLEITRPIRQISLPDYITWDDALIKKTIFNELGWQKREDGSTDHVDCFFAPVKNYLVVDKWGFGEKTTKYSAMVRAGQMARDDALERAEVEETKDISRILDMFMGLLDVQIHDIKGAREKTHLAYM